MRKFMKYWVVGLVVSCQALSASRAEMEPVSRAKGTRAEEVARNNALIPRSEIFEKDGERFQQFYLPDGKPAGAPIPLHPTMIRAWGMGYDPIPYNVPVDSGDGRGKGRKTPAMIRLGRVPVLLFLGLRKEDADWYNGAIPLRSAYEKQLPNRHPLRNACSALSVAGWPRPGSLPSLEKNGGADKLVNDVSEKGPAYNNNAGNRAIQAALEYANFYDYAASKTGNVTDRDREYARQGVRLLARLAEVCPQWLKPQLDQLTGYPFGVKPDIVQHGLWIERPNQFKRNLASPLPVAWAYDLLYNATDAWKSVSAEKGYDVKKRVEQDLLHNLLWSFAKMSGNFEGGYNNRDKYIAEIYMNWAVALDDPVLFHFGFRKLDDQVRTVFMADGTYYELCYIDFLVRSLLDEIGGLPRGYLDPPGWKDPFDGSHIDEKLNVGYLYKHVLGIAHFYNVLRMPDGRMWSLNETAWEKRPFQLVFEDPKSELYKAPFSPIESGPGLLTWSGHSLLGKGMYGEQVQARFEYSDHSSPHMHDDAFTLGYYAKGQELLADNSYVHHDNWPRGFSRSASDHNTVVIRGSGSAPVTPAWTPFSGPKPAGQHYVGGKILVPGMKLLSGGDGKGQGRISQVMWDPDGPVNFMEIYHPEKRGGMHRRSAVLVPTKDDNTYLLDVYRVAGGALHEWSVHGPSQYDYRINVSGLKLSDPAEADDAAPAALGDKGGLAEGVGLAAEELAGKKEEDKDKKPERTLIRTAKTDKTFSFDTVTPEFPDKKGRQGCLRSIVAGAPETTVMHCLTGNARNYLERNKGERSARKDHLYLRRPEKGQGNTFVAVHEPYEMNVGQPLIQSVESLQGGSAGLVAVKVMLPEREDYIFLSPDGKGSYKDGQVEFEGRAGFVSLDRADGRAVSMHLPDGGRIAAGGQELKAPETFTAEIGKILRVLDGSPVNGFAVKRPLPAGMNPDGRWMAVEMGDGHIKWFPVKSVRQINGETVLVTEEEPGFAFGSVHDEVQGRKVDYTEYLYHPRARVLGGLQVKLGGRATWTRAAPSVKAGRDVIARQDAPFRVTLGGGNAGLRFRMINGPSWVTVAPDGSLSGQAGNDKVGTNKILLAVQDRSYTESRSTVSVVIENVNDAPAFIAKEMILPGAAAGLAYQADVVNMAADVDGGDAIHFRKVDGPAWLTVSPDGVLSGTPALNQAGAQRVTIAAVDKSGAEGKGVFFLNVKTSVRVVPDGVSPSPGAISWSRALSLFGENKAFLLNGGTYPVTGQLNLPKGLEIHGGYSSTGERDPLAFPSILDLGPTGESVQKIVCSNVEDVVLSGLTIANGAGAAKENASLKVEGLNGVALHLDGKRITVRECVIRDNREGPAVLVAGPESDVVFEDCIFFRNSTSAATMQKALVIRSSLAKVKIGRCFFIDNRGGAFYGGGPEVSVANSVFAGNSAEGGDNIKWSTASAATIGGQLSELTSLANCVFARNINKTGRYSTAVTGGGLMMNSLFYENMGKDAGAVQGDSWRLIGCVLDGNVSASGYGDPGQLRSEVRGQDNVFGRTEASIRDGIKAETPLFDPAGDIRGRWQKSEPVKKGMTVLYPAGLVLKPGELKYRLIFPANGDGEGKYKASIVVANTENTLTILGDGCGAVAQGEFLLPGFMPARGSPVKSAVGPLNPKDPVTKRIVLPGFDLAGAPHPLPVEGQGPSAGPSEGGALFGAGFMATGTMRMIRDWFNAVEKARDGVVEEALLAERRQAWSKGTSKTVTLRGIITNEGERSVEKDVNRGRGVYMAPLMVIKGLRDYVVRTPENGFVSECEIPDLWDRAGTAWRGKEAILKKIQSLNHEKVELSVTVNVRSPVAPGDEKKDAPALSPEVMELLPNSLVVKDVKVLGKP